MAWGIIIGWRKGLLVEAATLVALLIGVTGAFKLTNAATELLATTFHIQSKFLPMFAFLSVFVGLVLGIHFLAKTIEKLLKKIKLGFLNNLAGAAFGFLKAAFMSSIIVWLLSKVHFISPETAAQSISYDFLMAFAPKMLHYAGVVLPYAQGLFGQMTQLFDSMKH
jgi:membrane protein required for colicin V production